MSIFDIWHFEELFIAFLFSNSGDWWWLQVPSYSKRSKEYIRVTSLEQLSLAEFSVEYARPKVYENGHKNVPRIWMDWDSNFNIWKKSEFLELIILIFHVKKLKK